MQHGPSTPAFDDPETHTLISLAKRGDQQAFTRLVRKYEELVFRYAYKLCRDEERAEEAFQDTFVNVFRRLRQFDGRSKFSSWLYTIVSNNCLMKLRKTKLAKASLSLDAGLKGHDDSHPDAAGHENVAPWKETPLDGVVKDELRSELERAISLLPPAYRAVFVLRDIEDRSAQETAKILKISIPAVKSRLHRARAFLRDELHSYMSA